MGKKKAARRDIGASDPEQLRKRLRKAEGQLLDATAKRDRAQARVEALAIIADEIRAQLADTENVATAVPVNGADDRGATEAVRSTPSAATGHAT